MRESLRTRLIASGAHVSEYGYPSEWPGTAVAFGRNTKVAGDDLATLREIPNLTRLSLAHAKFTPKDLRHLGGLLELRALDLNNTSFADTGVVHVAGLPKLRWLNLYCTKISNDALKKIAVMPTLEQLFLGETRVGESGIAQLRRCKALRYLDLENNEITDTVLKSISAIRDLEGLNIASYRSSVTDRGVEHLLTLSKLRLLGFNCPGSVSAQMNGRLRNTPSLHHLRGGCAGLFHTRDPYC